MHSSVTAGIGMSVFVLLLMAIPVSAHQGWGGNQSAEFEVTGTVHRAVSLAGPHASVQLVADGQVWNITLAPPTRTRRAGLTEDINPVGAEVTRQGHRNSDMNRFEVKTERLMWNGQTFDVYPNRD